MSEELLASLWSALLHVGRVGRKDDFFQLGGHSLLAMQLVSRVREAFATEVEIRSVYDYSSLQAFAAHIDNLVAVDGLDEERLEAMTEAQAEQLLSELRGR